MGVVTLEDRRVGTSVALLTLPDWFGMQDWVGWLDILHLVVVVGVSELAVMVVVVWVSESSVGSELVELVMCRVRLGELRIGSELVELVTCQVRLACAALKFFFSPEKFSPPGPRAKPHMCQVKSGWLEQPLNFISQKFFHPRAQTTCSWSSWVCPTDQWRLFTPEKNRNAKQQKLNEYEIKQF
jgi:hypothetical protein